MDSLWLGTEDVVLICQMIIAACALIAFTRTF